MVTLVTVVYKALFYAGLSGNQTFEKCGYSNHKKWLLGGIYDR